MKGAELAALVSLADVIMAMAVPNVTLDGILHDTEWIAKRASVSATFIAKDLTWAGPIR